MILVSKTIRALLLGAVLLAGTVGMVGCASENQSRQAQWRTCELEIEQFPVLQSSLHWHPIYDRMIDVGISPPTARRNVRRAARFGPARSEIETIVSTHNDAASLQEALDLKHAEALDARFREGTTLGYAHPRPKYEPVKAEPKPATGTPPATETPPATATEAPPSTPPPSDLPPDNTTETPPPSSTDALPPEEPLPPATEAPPPVESTEAPPPVETTEAPPMTETPPPVETTEAPPMTETPPPVETTEAPPMTETPPPVETTEAPPMTETPPSTTDMPSTETGPGPSTEPPSQPLPDEPLPDEPLPDEPLPDSPPPGDAPRK